MIYFENVPVKGWFVHLNCLWQKISDDRVQSFLNNGEIFIVNLKKNVLVLPVTEGLHWNNIIFAQNQEKWNKKKRSIGI